MKSIVLRYGEINLKGKNRNLFEKALNKQIKYKIKDLDVKQYKEHNRIYLDVVDEQSELLLERCLKLPGIENVSIAQKCSTDYEEIKNLALAIFDKTNPCFRVTTKRSYKKFPLNSQEMSRQIGAEILKKNDGLKGMQVSMKNYDQEIGIEISQDSTYIFHKKYPGMGGLPIGSSGYGLVMLSGGIDSPVAAIETMKRGVKINCVHFSTPPYTTQEALKKIEKLINILKEYDPTIKLLNFNMTDTQLEIKDKCKDSFTLLLMRRMMFRKASQYALEHKFDMIITGESLGQVASQTVESMTMTNKVSDVIIIRPLVSFNKNEIITLAKKYGTYETSIIPFEDACTIFAPQKPETRPKEDKVLEQEEKFDYKKYLNEIKLEKEEKENITIDKYL